MYCEYKQGAWRLIVAIADVSHYVSPGSAIDLEALRRGNSVYFPDYVVPMLPERLSDDLCSLKPEQDRLCFAVEMFINDTGTIEHFNFESAVMRSAARLTYTETAQALVEQDQKVRSRLQAVIPTLESLHTLSKLLRRQRMRSGAVDFDLPETRIVFNDDRKIQRIEPVSRNQAHQLIEECMLAANICAAQSIRDHQVLKMFRSHEDPDRVKVEDVRRFLREFGLSLGGGSEPTAKDYSKVVTQSQNKPYTRVVHTALLRSMKQAVYSNDNFGHFALGFDCYTHFTSPIRRYPDLVVHREIKSLNASKSVQYDEIDQYRMADIADHCSMTERRADDATREVIQWLKAEFMQDHVGEEFAGTITSVTDFGVFVELDEFLIEGLVHVTALGRDYFHFDPIAHRLTGERSGSRYEVGGCVQVKVVHVELDEAKIDLQLVGQGTERRKVGRKRSAKSKRRKK